MYIGYGVDCSEQTWTAVNWHVVVVRVMVPVHVSPMTRTAVNQRLFGSTAVRVVEPYLTRTGTVVCTHHQSSSPTTHHVIVIVSSYKCYSVRTDSEICCSLKFAQYVDRKFLSSALQWNLALRDRGSIVFTQNGQIEPYSCGYIKKQRKDPDGECNDVRVTMT